MSGSFKFDLASFYFLRHGETPESQKGILQGQTETELNAVGRNTARHAAKSLAGVEIRSIYASPLKRAWQTACILSELTGAPIYPAPGLMERSWGIYEGRPKNERPSEENPATVEPMDVFSGRILDAMQSISGPTPLLIVAHSGVFRVLAGHAGLPVGRSTTVSNAQLYLFEPPTGDRRHWNISEVIG